MNQLENQFYETSIGRKIFGQIYILEMDSKKYFHTVIIWKLYHFFICRYLNALQTHICKL
jgi:hypothetical protein